MQGFCHLVASRASNYCIYHIIITFFFLLEAFDSREQNRKHIVSLALKLLSLVACGFVSELHSVALKMDESSNWSFSSCSNSSSIFPFISPPAPTDSLLPNTKVDFLLYSLSHLPIFSICRMRISFKSLSIPWNSSNLINLKSNREQEIGKSRDWETSRRTTKASFSLQHHLNRNLSIKNLCWPQ